MAHFVPGSFRRTVSETDRNGKKRDRRGRATDEEGFYHYAFLVRKK